MAYSVGMTDKPTTEEIRHKLESLSAQVRKLKMAEQELKDTLRAAHDAGMPRAVILDAITGPGPYRNGQPVYTVEYVRRLRLGIQGGPRG